jgi:hypothetical protein
LKANHLATLVAILQNYNLTKVFFNLCEICEHGLLAVTFINLGTQINPSC